MFRVFSRKAYRKVRNAWGTSFVPGHSRKTTIATVRTEAEARAICKDGPANKAIDAGKEYRHLSFYEYEAI